ncbi:DUF262 domain-containing protein [Deinococcus sp. 6YEL10]|uniref:DUF262 and DUF1524 domain-containing protein n=1 Tax=Deinococcus sp. 6YEL10 TaxID=2745870 RepID=UPI001E64FD79|nr:DUF262 and DUF1524 domain-containing protein [Deinococcus sp. 6YEL10]MCD0163254.1 DUF262 domain-containing protein [Deinococcus sp. 6YEL10]
MKAKESKLLKFLQGEKQFYVPIYQRTYSWLRPQCEQYWHDLLTAGRDEKVDAHFLGAVVYIGRGVYSASDVSQMLVIDGQQRLTTTTLLLLALARHLGPIGEIILKSEAEDGSINETRITSARIRENFLINKHEEGGDGYYKLMLTQSDRSTLQRLLTDSPPEDAQSVRVQENLAYFEERLKDEHVDLQDVYRGLQKLVIVDVALEQGKDNPQLIFESMNSTGLDLTQADLIRNFMLMGLEPKAQTKLYNDYWKPMETRFAGRDPQHFDRFVRDYLSLRAPSNTPSRLDHVYVSFKRYALASPDMTALVKDLSTLSAYYAAILDPAQVEKDSVVRQALLDLAALKLDVVTPFTLQVYADWQQGVIDRAEFIAVLKLTESYLFRRSVVGINSQGLNKLFPDLPRRVDQTNYVQSLQDALFELKTYLRFPRDGEFKEALIHRDLYQVKRLCGYTLLKLENFDHKEPIALGGLTIEHVLPQTENLNPEWLAMLGPDADGVQSRHLHTLGNLTLTGYNSELSARPFLEKRDMKGGFRDSHLRLNADLAKLEEWNEPLIQERAARLAEMAVQVWPALSPSDEARARVDEKRSRVQKVERSVEDHLAGASTELRELFEDVSEGLLNLHEDASMHAMAVYVAFKVGTNFCDLTVQTGVNNLRCWLNMPYSAIEDPLGRVRDVKGKGHHGNGDVEVSLQSGDDVEWFLGLAQQALAYQLARVTTSGGAAATLGAALAALPDGERAALATFESRLLQLDPALERNVTRYYVGYGRPIELTIILRDGAPVIDIQPRDPEVLPPAVYIGWEARGKDRFQRTLRVQQDADQAMPLVTAAHEQFSRGVAYREGNVRQLVRSIREAFKSIGAALKAGTSVDYYAVGGEDIARLWINKSNVYLVLRKPFEQLANPHELGEAVHSDPLAGWTPGYFGARLSNAEETETVVGLIHQMA